MLFIIISISVLNCFQKVSSDACPQCDKQFNTLSQCPCFKPKDTSDCLQFDSRYLATSLDEAMFSFPNLVSTEQHPLFTKESHRTAPLYSTSSAFQTNVQQTLPATNNFMGDSYGISTTSSTCSSPECLECKLYIVNGFINNSKPPDHDSLWLEKQEIQRTLGKTQGSCTRSKDVQSRVQFSSKGCCKDKKDRNMVKEKDKKVEELSRLLRSWRSKREIDYSSTAQKEKLLGISTQLGCDYRRGSALESNTKWSGLCNLCWQWRKLPEEYFPSYLNEVSCDSNDSGCLAGFGSCRAVVRSLNVLRNIGTTQQPNWTQTTIDIAAACECQVELGTPLHSLVMK